MLMTRMRSLPRHFKSDSGFSLAESIVSATIIVVIVLGFALFMSNYNSAQTRVRNDTIASRVLSDQMESLAGIPWDDLMMTGSGECQLDTIRKSSAVVAPGPQTQKVDGLTVSITRKVTWSGTDKNATPTLVTCANTPNDRDDLKTVSVTVRWNDANGEKTKTLSTYRSRWS